MFYTSVVTVCLLYFLHSFEAVQCRSSRHLNEYNNRSSLTPRCLRSCFLVRKISSLIYKLKHFCLSDSVICTDKCKIRLDNEMFSVRIPDDRILLQTIDVICSLQRYETKCPSRAMSTYLNWISWCFPTQWVDTWSEFFPFNCRLWKKKLWVKTPRKYIFLLLIYTATGIDFDSAAFIWLSL